MKQTVSLYIGGQLADLSDDSLIEMNYTTEDLLNPTVVKNSYSQQVTLPGTARNNAIFGQIYRFDANIITLGGNTGVQFSPLARTPFVIYSESSEILERGYIKLDSIERNGESVSYTVTLYGGLGSLLYQLSYKEEDGEKLTLADLAYDAGGETDVDLDFNINVNTVGLAWNTISDNGGLPEKFDVLNFAPAYNGIPDGGFSADKAVSVVSAFGADPLYSVQTSVTQDGKTYGLSGGYTLLDLGKERTEWEVKDLRSYLQRPVISVQKIFEAMQKRASEWGITLNLDNTFFNDDNPYYSKTWLLLPSLSTLQLDSTEKTISITAPDITDTSGNINLELALSDTLSAGELEATFTIPQLAVDILTSEEIYLLSLYDDHTQREHAWFIQLYGTDANGNVVGNSDVAVLLSSDSTLTSAEAATQCGFTPKGSASYQDAQKSNFKWSKMVGEQPPEYVMRYVWQGGSFTFETGMMSKAAHIYVAISCMITGSAGNYSGALRAITYSGQGLGMYSNTPTLNNVAPAYGSIYISSFEGARSGSLIPKSTLLDTGNSVADYLLSFCKMFGLMLVYDKDDQAVNIMTRNTFYSGGQVIDLSQRIDYSQKISTTPFEFDACFYDMNVEYAEGEFAEQYATKYGREYGRQRINTGFSFNSETKDILENLILQGACEVTEQSLYFTNITEDVDGDTYIVPSIFIDGDVSYKLYASDGSTVDLDAQAPTNAADITYFDPTYKGYDWFSKIQLHDEDDKGLDIQDVLLFYTGSMPIKSPVIGADNPYENFHLTDDLPIMSTLNEGKPCWILPPFAGRQANFSLPKFGRYITSGGQNYSLDFGAPAEIDQPGATFDETSTVYARGWEKYLADRYDVNSRVVTCYVDFRGIRVGAELLRNFYYFGNAVWVLNKITNYAITEDGTVQCEFVKVQDVENYTNGQNY